jgi:hypothetical protein
VTPTTGEGFVVPDSDIVPAGREQWRGVAVLAAYVIQDQRKHSHKVDSSVDNATAAV